MQCTKQCSKHTDVTRISKIRDEKRLEFWTTTHIKNVNLDDLGDGECMLLLQIPYAHQFDMSARTE